VLEQVRAAIVQWQAFAEVAGLAEAEARRIADQLLPLGRRRAVRAG
jgi:hypothetical protein